MINPFVCNWINKKDRQPEHLQKVIVWSGDNDLIEAYWFAPDNDFVDTLECQKTFSDYWIPFPIFPIPDEERNNDKNLLLQRLGGKIND